MQYGAEGFSHSESLRALHQEQRKIFAHLIKQEQEYKGDNSNVLPLVETSKMTALERTLIQQVDYRGILDDAEDKDSALSVAYSAFEKVDKKLDEELYVAYGLLAISFVFACMEDYWAQHELGLLWGSAAGLGFISLRSFNNGTRGAWKYLLT